MKILEFCNNNSGFLSAVLAIASILLSYVAIRVSRATAKGQIDAQLFEKRVDLYSEVKEIYIICNSLIEKNNNINHLYPLKMRLFIADLFSPETKECVSALGMVVLKEKMKKVDESSDEYISLLEKWTDEYCEITVYELYEKKRFEKIKTRLHLLFSKEVEIALYQLIEQYADFRWRLWELDESQIKEAIDSLKTIIDELKDKEIFLKMDQEILPNL
ncbi:MAG: hypothetical protein MR278_04875 [Bacteroidales bacterium]|nr:hypothetical protein [Bacteroidales bacterium]